MTKGLTVQIGFQRQANCTDSFAIGILIKYGSAKVAYAMDWLWEYYAIKLEVIVF